MRMLSIFHAKLSENLYQHLDEYSQVCEIHQVHKVLTNVTKMNLFPLTLKDRAKDWFMKLKIGKTRQDSTESLLGSSYA